MNNSLQKLVRKLLRFFESRQSPKLDSTLPADPLPEWENVGEWRDSISGGGGWSAPSIVQTQVEKWDDFLNSVSGPGPLGVSHEEPLGSGRANLWAHNLVMSYANVVGIAAVGREVISILDWGSGIGHYCTFTKALYPDLTVDYTGHDLPALCEAGRRLHPEQKFTESADECLSITYELVMAGSSLWYVRDWRKTAAQLSAATGRFLYITRMMFVEEAYSFVAVQRPHSYGYETEYQCWILNQSEFLNHMERQGMTLVREFLFGPGPAIHNAPERGHFKGFLFKKGR